MHVRKISISLVCAILVAIFVSAELSAQGPNESELRTLRSIWTTGYIAGVGQISLETTTSSRKYTQGAFELTWDPNACNVNEFGEASGCTRIATSKYPVKLKESHKYVITSQPHPALAAMPAVSTKRFDLVLDENALRNVDHLNADPEKLTRLALVVTRSARQQPSLKLLLLNETGGIDRVMPLSITIDFHPWSAD